MTIKKLAIASDHAGFEVKNAIIAAFSDIEWVDLGPESADRVDYPDFADKLAKAIKDGQADYGVLVCGSGIGISIAANRHRHIRAALCHDVTTATLCRQHNDANVLAVGSRTSGFQVIVDMVNTFVSTPFEGGRHAGRVAKMS